MLFVLFGLLLCTAGVMADEFDEAKLCEKHDDCDEGQCCAAISDEESICMEYAQEAIAYCYGDYGQSTKPTTDNYCPCAKGLTCTYSTARFKNLHCASYHSAFLHDDRCTEERPGYIDSCLTLMENYAKECDFRCRKNGTEGYVVLGKKDQYSGPQILTS